MVAARAAAAVLFMRHAFGLRLARPRWRAPLARFAGSSAAEDGPPCIMHFDGGARGNPGPSGCGAVVHALLPSGNASIMCAPSTPLSA